MQIPHYLVETDWAGYELAVLRSLIHDIKRAASKLERGMTTERIHDLRVVLRRWQSVCGILDADGLNAKGYKTAKQKLRKLRKRLGDLRDLEILVELAQRFELPKKTIAQLERRCERLREKTVEEFEYEPIARNLKAIKKAIDSRSKPVKFFDVKKQRPGNDGWRDSAFGHLEPHLDKLEERVRTLERRAFTPEQLHELRIAIKSWRFFLTEFYGLTNLELVRAQQLLGKVHDIDRLLLHLQETQTLGLLDQSLRTRIDQFKQDLLEGFGKWRKHLPYGLRPAEVSLEDRPKPTSTANQL